MTNLGQTIKIAQDLKPKFSEPCNNCGWCCLTEVCEVGKMISGSEQIPCSLLTSVGNKHTCSLVERLGGYVIGAGVGCCAKTQDEVIKELTNV